jgi:outer membrane murein-binding lipoprotein Lpp
MIRLIGCLALATIVAAGCASAPQPATTSTSVATLPAAGAQTGQEDAGAAAGDAIAAGAAPAATGAVPAEPTTASAAAAPAVVDANLLTQAPGSIVICRDVLITGSNVMTTRCMTRDDWKRFEYIQMIEAQETLRKMQGSAFPR